MGAHAGHADDEHGRAGPCLPERSVHRQQRPGPAPRFGLCLSKPFDVHEFMQASGQERRSAPSPERNRARTSRTVSLMSNGFCRYRHGSCCSR